MEFDELPEYFTEFHEFSHFHLFYICPPHLAMNIVYICGFVNILWLGPPGANLPPFYTYFHLFPPISCTF